MKWLYWTAFVVGMLSSLIGDSPTYERISILLMAMGFALLALFS